MGGKPVAMAPLPSRSPEQGPGLVAVHAVLLEYHQKHPSNMVHRKWVVDIANAVEHAFTLHGVPVCRFFETCSVGRVLITIKVPSNTMKKGSATTQPNM